ncbi:D-alanine--D-alanine ligase [Bacillus toyonensis]|uniref:D-alanine--D-alanine ligase n=1 Tax=Bacillus toyonensis TaxID=155322 RepID=A0A2B5Y3N0_9BACI|nr:D-alanine--D-alanine ligase [Bacillus toyonensis]PHD60842.1 D-alanine--D-alanine ligase [Bacillus toyonensis]
MKKWLVYKPIILPLYDRVLSTRYRIHINYANFQEIVERITGYDIYQ